MSRQQIEKPPGAPFVGFSALAQNHDKIKRRRKVDKIKVAHAHDHLIYGCDVFRRPKNKHEAQIYARNGVVRTSTGKYFTTVRPFPSELEPFFIRVMPSREEVARTQKDIEKLVDRLL